MKPLHLVFHPDLASSKVNRIWRDMVKDHAPGVVSRDMYAEYPDFEIDVSREQDLLQAHGRIVIQFPFYWYSSPPLLKKWLDDVLTYGFAYGSSGKALRGKELQLILSLGAGPSHYSEVSVVDLLAPFEMTAKLCNMTYREPLYLYGASNNTDAEIHAFYDDEISILFEHISIE